MAKSINKVILIGRLGKDPELKYTASGTPFCRFSMATDDVWNDKASGERQEKTEWHSIVVWDRLRGPDHRCTALLREAILTVGLFTEPDGRVVATEPHRTATAEVGG